MPVGSEFPRTALQIVAKRIRVPATAPNPRTATGLSHHGAQTKQAEVGQRAGLEKDPQRRPIGHAAIGV